MINILDIVIAVILFLAFIIGISRGTFKSMLKLFSMALALGLTLLMADTVAKFILNNPVMSEMVFGNTVSLKALYGQIPDGWQDSTLLNALYAPMIEKLTALGFTGVTAQQMLPSAMAFQSGIVIGCFMLYLVFRIVIMIIAFIIKKLVRKSRKSGLSRLFGGLLGIVNGAIIVSILLSVVMAFVPAQSLSSTVSNFAQDSFAVKHSTTLTQQIATKTMVSDENLKSALTLAGFTLNQE